MKVNRSAGRETAEDTNDCQGEIVEGKVCVSPASGLVDIDREKKVLDIDDGPLVLERFLKNFYHILAWLPSLLCDPDAANKLSFFLPKEAPN